MFPQTKQLLPFSVSKRKNRYQKWDLLKHSTKISFKKQKANTKII